MTNIKRKLALLICLALSLVMIFILSSCTDSELSPSDEPGTDTTPEHFHVEELLPALAPTCTTTGLTEGKKCSVCNEILVEQQTIPLLNHKLENSYTCSMCKYEFYKESQGLAYALNSDKTYYTVTGIGTCIDTKIVIPYAYEGLPVKAIGNGAFKDCTSLTSITIPNSVTEIGASAFSWCFSLTSVIIPNSVTSIGERAFSNCTSLESIIIPNNVNWIGEQAFDGCTSLTIYCEATEEPSDWDLFWNRSNRPVYWYSESQPSTSGNYWHYGTNGEILIW